MTSRNSTGRSWRIRVPATAANLGPGFDCFGLALQRYLTAEAHVLDDPGIWNLSISGEGADRVSTDRTNLIYQAYAEGCRRTGDSTPGIRLHVSSEIPLARGQGSSAAAIVLGLALAGLATSGDVIRQEALQIATEMEGHPDNVAAALLGGFVVSRRAPDGTVRARSIPTGSGVTFVAAVPDFELSTAKSRETLPEEVAINDALFNVHASAWMVAAWASGDWESVAEAMDDRLHQPYRTGRIPGYAAVREAAMNAGAMAVCLSGSGPTLLALASGEGEAIAEAMGSAWEACGVSCRAAATLVDEHGLHFESLDD